MRILSYIKLTAVLAAACLLIPAQVMAQRAVPVDRVVAVVNNEVVTALELRERVQAAIRQLQQRGIEAPPLEVLEEQVLERMIIERAQLQLAAETGLRMDEATVDRAIASIARNNNLSEEELRSVLIEDGISWERFRQEIRTELTITRLREREVESEIVVTEAEIDNFIANNPDAFSGEELFVAHVLIRMPEAPSQADLARYMARAEEVLSRHAAGEDFAQLAAAYSDAPDSTQGGALGWRSRDRLPGLFADAVRTLRPGEVSPVLRSPAGLHIVKFVAMRGGELAGGVDEMEQTRARHILIRTTEVLSDAEAEARLLGLRERMVQGSERFEELARIHSDDLSAARGGDLGWIYPGDTVPEFERAMDALAPGEISQPVRSPFGWHLIEVVERRVQDVSDERMRAATRNALRERKAEEAYDAWLRELRDSTFVEYRLETDF
ncbi:peptidylprolyl isomerase [Azoarcus taiwanensis]|uniref:Chaperone SurA n=1 Tax=Azoarcus taiwanensis TaxID=666964 RepID=A0A972FBC5_9RHOO|nr:peptidylprolyl isomerase [Azoarcus taiwanensis]NMG02148.1 molecular chaperone SurA [Azoarcus taiwanensis]